MTIRSITCSMFTVVTLLAGAALAQPLAHGHHGGLRAACGEDIEKSCKDAEHGRAAFECLKAHRDALSDSCKSFLDQHHHESSTEPPKE